MVGVKIKLKNKAIFIGTLMLFTGKQVFSGIRPIDAAETQSAGIYVFKDAKKDGTVTFTKKWKDNKDNDERQIPDIEISTAKPEGMIVKYKVIFHSNGLAFDDGTTENEMTYTENGQILDGQYKMPNGTNVCWYTDTSYSNRVVVANDGTLNTEITKNIDLYAKEATFVLQNGDDFNSLIPDDARTVYFTDEIMPETASLIDVDNDGDCGVVAWMDGTVMKVSSQISDVSVIANQNCKNMFNKKTNLSEIYFDNIDTSNTTNIQSMFYGCSGLQKLDLASFNTSKVIYMNSAFANCNQLKQVNIKSFNTSSVTNMNSMFSG